MKPRALLRLIVSLLVILGFVVAATVLEANGSPNTTAWYWAQRKLPLLWAVDGFAVLTLLPVLGFATLQNRLARKSEEFAQIRDEHQNQIEAMNHNAEETERLNAEQAERIAALQETVASLSAKLTDVQTEATARQRALEAEAHRLAEQAFAALVGQVEANTRQMEAVNLAMQYQRAEIKQLRQGMRAMQNPHDVIDVEPLFPAELTALRDEDAPRLLEDSEEEKGRREEKETRRGEEEAQEEGGGRQKRKPEAGRRKTYEEATQNRQSSIVNRPSTINHQPLTPPNSVGFFEPTMNAETTFIAPMTEYQISPSLADIAAGTETDAPMPDVAATAEATDTPPALPDTSTLPTPDGATAAEAVDLLPDQTADSALEPTAPLEDETEQAPPRKSGLRRWLSRS